MSGTKPWLNNYPSGVPANINPDEFPTMNNFFDDCFKRYGKQKAYSCMGKEFTYDEIDERSRNFAAYLHYRGLKPGDRIAIMMPNLLQYPIALMGAVRAGIIIVNVNPLYTAREMLAQFKDSQAKAIVIVENFASKLEEVLPQTNIDTIIVTSIGELLGGVKGAFVNFAVRNIKRMVPSFNLPNSVSFKVALKEGKGKTISDFEDTPERVVFLQYTGGTTGIAKGAMLTNRNMVANMLQIGGILKPRLAEKQEVVLCPLPLYHIFALSVNCFAMMHIGALNVLVTNPRDLGSIIAEFKRYPLSLMTGVNTLFNALLQNEKFQKLDFSALNIVVGGGTAVQKAVAERWERVTGCPLTEGYGLTETSPVASVNPVDGSGKLGTIGLPVPSTDMRVVDDSGSVLPANEVGEIQIFGPQVMKGYYNRPDETAKVLKDGWLSTGDMGMMHDDGYFEIVDRKKDMINVSGFNVYPNEVEDVLASFDKILEVACVGVPDDRSGETVKVFIIKKDKSLTEDEVVAYARKQLTGYKVPHQVEFVDDLPKTTVGKILRRELREREIKKLKGTA